jgi:hypothetical protein
MWEAARNHRVWMLNGWKKDVSNRTMMCVRMILNSRPSLSGTILTFLERIGAFID